MASGSPISTDPIFTTLDADTTEAPTEIESYCVNCEENGITRILFTKIPHFREIVVMAFECPHCAFRSSEVQSAGMIQEHGERLTCRIESEEDLNRQVVKSETAIVRIEEADFEIPASTQRGVLTTVEGMVSRAIEGLETNQPLRKVNDEILYNQIETVLSTLRAYQNGDTPFTFTLDDPAGNSYIESLTAPHPDPTIRIIRYTRTPEHNEAIGLPPVDQPAHEITDGAKMHQVDDAVPEVMIFKGLCSRCHAPCDTNMSVIDIPHFKEVVIMSTNCGSCGYKSNEVKGGSGIPPKGRRITLRVRDIDDLSRDLLKSETCGISIPEVELELGSGTLGGRFTTVEGLLTQIYEELQERTPFLQGDSVDENRRGVFASFLHKLKRVLAMEVQWTLVLDDPLGNSYLQNPYAPDPDPNMTSEDYERSWEQNEFLGLNDMVLENYGEQDQAEKQNEGVARNKDSTQIAKKYWEKDTILVIPNQTVILPRQIEQGFVTTMANFRISMVALCLALLMASVRTERPRKAIKYDRDQSPAPPSRDEIPDPGPPAAHDEWEDIPSPLAGHDDISDEWEENSEPDDGIPGPGSYAGMGRQILHNQAASFLTYLSHHVTKLEAAMDAAKAYFRADPNEPGSDPEERINANFVHHFQPVQPIDVLVNPPVTYVFPSIGSGSAPINRVDYGGSNEPGATPQFQLRAPDD
ncbi:hypothetical protein SeLEV6574_g07752 [Synchytrium endobioticum]|uniref:Zinc finger ZPR1-type domain-containing protein n=1 Tax=Synchytrium endobioticum TaxID=286115 RepID=A0A507CJN7_9FUNG|nr:hypothetical protein SeLEV6574_g07752 [Synchytrium endobioticum]